NPSNISNLKQQPNHLKKSGDVPPTINKPLDKSEPEQHFSEIEQDNTSLQDNTYPSDFEVTTPANDYDIPQYDNLDDYASQDVQPIPSNDKFAVSPHAKRNRNLSRPKQQRTKGLRISRPLEQSTSESETDKATEEDFPPTIDGSFDLSEPKQHFSEIEQENTSPKDDIYPSDFEITTPENDYGISQLNNFEDFSSQDDQPLPNNAKFAELPPHMIRNRNRSRPKQHRTKGLRILRPLESSTSESETDTVTEEDFPPTIDGPLDVSDPQQHFSETEENNAYSQDDNYPTNFEITTLANDYDSPQLNDFEDYTSQDDRPIPNNSKFAQFPPHVKRNRNQFRPKQHRTKGARISPPLKSSTSESDIDTTTEGDYSSQYPLKQKSVKVTGPGEIYSLPYDEWWKHLHTIKSPGPEESTEELNQQSTEQYTDNPMEDDFSNQDSSQQTVTSQDDGRSILVPGPERHRITPGEKSTSSNFRQPQTAPHAENDRLKRPYQRRRRPLQPNLRNKDANNKYRTVIPDYNQRGKRPLNFSDRFKNFGTQQLPDKIDTTTEDQSLYKNFPRTFNENNDTAENGNITVSNDEDTTLYESSTSYQLPSQTESQVFTPKSFVTQNELREKMRRKRPKLNRFPDGRTKLTRRPHPTEADIEAARKRLRQKFTDVLADDDDTTVSTENNGYNSSPETSLTQTDNNLTPENYFPQTEPFNSWKRTPPHFRRRLHPSSIDFADVTTEQQTFQQESLDEQSNTDGTSPSSSDYEYEFPTPSELNYDNYDTTILINNYEYESTTVSMDDYRYKSTAALISDYEHEFTTVSKEDDKYESTTSLINNYDFDFSSNPSLLLTDYEFTSIPSLFQTNYEFPPNPSLLNIDYEYSTLEHTSPENNLDPSERKKLPHTKFGFPNSGENIGTHTSPADFTKDRETEPQDYQEEITNTESTILNIASSENSELEFTTAFPDGTTATEIYSTIRISPSDLTYNSDEFSGTELLTEDVSTTTIANLDEDSSGTDSATESGSTMEVTKNSLKPFRIKDASHPDMRRKRRKKIKGKNITDPPYPMKNRSRKPKIPTSIPNDFSNFSFPGDFFSDMLSGLTETPSTENSNVSTETPSTENAEINTETPCAEDAIINTEAASTEQTEINTETPNTGDEEINTEIPSTGDAELNTKTLSKKDEEINTEAPNIGDEEINTETPSTGDEEINTETPSKGYEEINRETSNNERITHIKPKKRRKKKKEKKSKIHRPKGSSGKTEETSNEESSTVTYSGTKEKESSTIFMTEPVTTPVTELDTILVSSSALPTTWPPDITSISESIITSESPITIMTTETTNTITEVSDLSAQISLSTTEAPFTAYKIPTTATEVPTSSTEVPTSTTEVPTTTTEVPTSTTEVPTPTTEIPTTVTEVPTTVTEVPTTVTEVPTTVTEVPTTVTEVPTTVTEVPTTVTEIPTTVTEVPTIVTEVPTTVTEVPTSTIEVPTSTTEVPTSTTEAPATSEETPVITIKPSTTTEIPSTISETPSTTTEIPSTTTKILITEMPTTTTETFTTEVPSSVSEVSSTATEIPKATSEILTSISKLSTTPSDISTKIIQVSKITSEIPNLSTKLSSTTPEDLSLTTKIPSTVSDTLAATTKTPPITTTETPTASKETVPTITETPVRTSKSSITVTKISTDTPTVMTEALTTVSEIPKTTAEILRTSEVSTTSEKFSTLTTPESIELTTIPATSIPIATSSDLSISATEFTSTVTSIPTEITEQTAASPSTSTVQITTETEQLSTSELLTSSSSQISTSSTNTEDSSPGSASLEATNSPDSTNMQPSISQSSTSLESVISPSSQEPIFTTETSAPMDATPRSIATKSVSTIETSVPSLTTSTPIITTPIPSAESTFTTSMESSSAGKTSDITEEFGSSSNIVNTASTASSMVTEISSTPAMNESTTLIGTTTEKFHASPLNNYTTIEPPAGVQCYENESYYACVPHCQHTCFNYDSDEPCPDFCEPGCGCNKGLLIDEKGRCVPPEDCFECK
ncbi:zonadhesin, partial [Trichonephila clavata]